MTISARIRQLITPLRLQMAIGLGAKGFAAVASFALNWLIARSLGAGGLGIFALAQTTATIAATLALVGLEYVVVREVARALKLGAPGEARRTVIAAAKQGALISCVLGLAIFLLRDRFASDLLGEGRVAPALAIMAAAVPALTLIYIASSALRGCGRVVVSQLISGPIGTGLSALTLAVVILAGLSFNTILPVSIYVGFAFVAGGFGWIVLLRAMREWPRVAGERPRLLRMGVPMLLATLSLTFVDWFAMLVLTANSSARDAGLFRIAWQIVSVLNLLTVASDAILAPHISQNYAVGARDRITVILSRTTAAMFVLASPLLALCLLAPRWLLAIIGPEFVEAALALQILAVGQIVNFLLGPIGSIIVMTRHENWVLGYGLVAALAAALLCLWLVPLYGVIGAALAVSAAIALRRISAAFIVHFVIGVKLWRWKEPS
jgi:O-antigen/teichoic acid export membrane protein